MILEDRIQCSLTLESSNPFQHVWVKGDRGGIWTKGFMHFEFEKLKDAHDVAGRTRECLQVFSESSDL